jgi:ABC-type sugar transport system substrate-binding protein
MKEGITMLKIGTSFQLRPRSSSCSIAAGLLAALAGIGMSSSGYADDAKPRTHVIGISVPYADVPVVTWVNKFIAQRAKERGYTGLIDPTQGGKIEGQQATMDSWIDQKADAIMGYSINPPVLAAIGRRAKAAGVAFYSFGDPVDGAIATVSPGMVSGGEAVGRVVVDWINTNNPQAEVILLTDSQNTATSARTSKPKEAIQSKTKATIVAEQDATTQEKGFEVVSTILQAHPNASVVVGLNDDGALGAARAFKQAGKDPSKVFIIGSDGSKPAIQELLKNDPNSFFKATAALDEKKVFVTAVDLMIDNLEKGAPATPVVVDVPPDVVTSKDAARLKELLANMGG